MGPITCSAICRARGFLCACTPAKKGQQWSPVCHRRPCRRDEESGGGGAGGGPCLPLPLLERLRGGGNSPPTSSTSPPMLPIPHPARQLSVPLALPAMQKTVSAVPPPILPLSAQAQLQPEDLGGAADRRLGGEAEGRHWWCAGRGETTLSIPQLSLSWSQPKVNSLR